MKTFQSITRLVAGAAIAVSGSAFAEVGMLDGADTFKDFKSTKSRAEVRGELDAPAYRGSLTDGNSEFSSQGRDANIGARGPAGSRYSVRTREEIQADLADDRRMHRENASGAIYRPN